MCVGRQAGYQFVKISPAGARIGPDGALPDVGAIKMRAQRLYLPLKFDLAPAIGGAPQQGQTNGIGAVRSAQAGEGRAVVGQPLCGKAS